MAHPALAVDLAATKTAFFEDFKKQIKSDPVTLAKVDAKLSECAMMFQNADADKSGDVDFDEISKLFEKEGRKKSKEDLTKLICLVDDDNSGTLRFCEFMNLILIEAGYLTKAIELSDDQPGLRSASSKPKKARGGQRKNGAVKKIKRGHLHLSASIVTGAKAYTLTVKIYAAKNLMACDLNGLSDPYVKMHLEPDPQKAHKKKTTVIKKNLSPVYNQEFTWVLDMAELRTQLVDLKDVRLNISVMDYDLIGSNDFIGGVSFTLEEIQQRVAQEPCWFVLLDEEQGLLHHFPSRLDEIAEAAAPSSRAAASTATVRASAAPAASAGKLAAAPSGAASAGGRKYTLADFEFLKVLGQGSFGKVMLARDKTTQKIFAVKALKKLGVIDSKDVPATMTERRVLALAGDPPFLARLHASFQSPSNLFFVMELITGGDLMMRIQKCQGFPEKTCVFYTAEICCALWFLHDRGILYRDLKLDNIMLDGEGHIKLADFGLCKEGVNLDGSARTFCGTPDYIAPEILDYKPYNRGVDFWSLGVVLYEMLTNSAPFDGEDEATLFANIRKQKIDLPRWLSKEAHVCVLGFLERDPAKRLGTGPAGKAKIQADKFFRTLDWAQLEARQVKPPYVPKAQDPLKMAAENFDPEFTTQKAVISPADPKRVTAINQAVFDGFSFTVSAL